MVVVVLGSGYFSRDRAWTSAHGPIRPVRRFQTFWLNVDEPTEPHKYKRIHIHAPLPLLQQQQQVTTLGHPSTVENCWPGVLICLIQYSGLRRSFLWGGPTLCKNSLLANRTSTPNLGYKNVCGIEWTRNWKRYSGLQYFHLNKYLHEFWTHSTNTVFTEAGTRHPLTYNHT